MFAEIEAHRYALEPHIPEIVRFEEWAGRDVLEVGCGIATNGVQLARAGARYAGVDASQVAGEAAGWTEDWLWGNGLHRLLCTIRYPGTA